MAATQKAVISPETSIKAYFAKRGVRITVMKPDPQREALIDGMISELYPHVSQQIHHATNSWKSTSSKVNPEENFTNVTVNVAKVTLTNGKKRYDINLSYSTTVNDI